MNYWIFQCSSYDTKNLVENLYQILYLRKTSVRVVFFAKKITPVQWLRTDYLAALIHSILLLRRIKPHTELLSLFLFPSGITILFMRLILQNFNSTWTCNQLLFLEMYWHGFPSSPFNLAYPFKASLLFNVTKSSFHYITHVFGVTDNWLIYSK